LSAGSLLGLQCTHISEKVGYYLPVYTAVYYLRFESSSAPLSEPQVSQIIITFFPPLNSNISIFSVFLEFFSPVILHIFSQSKEPDRPTLKEYRA